MAVIRPRHSHSGIVEIDVHGMTKVQAKTAIDAVLRAAGGAYRLRVVHGWRGGTELQQMVRRQYARHPAVLRIDCPQNPGSTDLVLRELV